MDDVLNDLTRSWLDCVWNPAHPEEIVRFEDLRENPPCTLLGISLDEYLSSLDAFRLGSGYAQQVPDPEILAWLEVDGDRCRNLALTATALRTAPTTAAWVLRHFGRWIREFAFIPARRAGESLPIYDADKGAWLARLGMPAILVDDSAQNAQAARLSGAPALTWPRPWNNGGTVAETLQSLTRFLDAGDAS